MKFDSAAESVLPQGTSLPSFLQNLDCISGFPCDFLFLVCLIRRGVKEVNPWVSALHRYIPMAILGKYDELLSIPQVFHIPLLYISEKSVLCERPFENFLIPQKKTLLIISRAFYLQKIAGSQPYGFHPLTLSVF